MITWENAAQRRAKLPKLCAEFTAAHRLEPTVDRTCTLSRTSARSGTRRLRAAASAASDAGGNHYEGRWMVSGDITECHSQPCRARVTRRRNQLAGDLANVNDRRLRCPPRCKRVSCGLTAEDRIGVVDVQPFVRRLRLLPGVAVGPPSSQLAHRGPHPCRKRPCASRPTADADLADAIRLGDVCYFHIFLCLLTRIYAFHFI